MNGFRNSSRNGQVWRYQVPAGGPLFWEVSGRWMEAAEAWRRAALHSSPDRLANSLPGKGLNTRHRRCRGRV